MNDKDFDADAVASGEAARKPWRKPELKVLPVDETGTFEGPDNDGAGSFTS